MVINWFLITNKLKFGKKLNKNIKIEKKHSIAYNDNNDKSLILDHNLQIKAMTGHMKQIEKKHAKRIYINLHDQKELMNLVFQILYFLV